MGIIHTPRTIASITRGLWKRYWRDSRKDAAGAAVLGGEWIGIGPEENHRHVYQARLGFFDVDYIGHMNNSAYLSHAEYARWEMSGYNGMLSSMYQNSVNFYVIGTTIRYRKEIRPIFRKFQIDTVICGLDDRNIWMSHKFRLPAKERHQESRVLAQMIVQAVVVQGRDVLDPRDFLKEKVGVDAELVDGLSLTDQKKHPSDVVQEMLQSYVALEESLKKAAADDDTKHQ